MKKYLIALIILTLSIASCEKDDFCIDATTPNLVIRLYDINNPLNYKTASHLYIWAEGKDTLVNYKDVSLDSIALPLDPSQDFTTYHLSSNDTEDTITINYMRNEIFVSRSCGYKYNFNNLNISGVTNNWILNTQTTNQTVDNETEHIKILH